VSARVSRAKFEKGRPSRWLRSEADSKFRESGRIVTRFSQELRERQTPTRPAYGGHPPPIRKKISPKLCEKALANWGRAWEGVASRSISS
jgi:hypothetical protein